MRNVAKLIVVFCFFTLPQLFNSSQLDRETATASSSDVKKCVPCIKYGTNKFYECVLKKGTQKCTEQICLANQTCLAEQTSSLCNSDANCANSQCVDGYCKPCPSGETYFYEKCTKIGDIGCNRDADCNDFGRCGKNGYCTLCPKGKASRNGKCEDILTKLPTPRFKKYLEDCENDEECVEANSRCYYNICFCIPSHYYNKQKCIKNLATGNPKVSVSLKNNWNTKKWNGTDWSSSDTYTISGFTVIIVSIFTCTCVVAKRRYILSRIRRNRDSSRQNSPVPQIANHYSDFEPTLNPLPTYAPSAPSIPERRPSNSRPPTTPPRPQIFLETPTAPSLEPSSNGGPDLPPNYEQAIANSPRFQRQSSLPSYQDVNQSEYVDAAF